jgi:hypothetical protein
MLLDPAPEAGAAELADVEPGEFGWLADDAHPAAATAQMSAAATKASQPDPESPNLDSPFMEYPGRGTRALGIPAQGNRAPGNTAVPFMCVAPHAPFGHYDDSSARLVVLAGLGPGQITFVCSGLTADGE